MRLANPTTVVECCSVGEKGELVEENVVVNGNLCKKSGLSFCLVVCVLVAFLGPSCVVFGSSPPAVSGAVSDALDYLNSVQSSSGEIESFETSCWVVMAVVAAGEDPGAGRWVGSGDASLVDYLIANTDQLNSSDALEVSYFLLSMAAAGVDPTGVGGVDYVALLKGLVVNGQIGDETLLTDDFWGVLALVSAGESVGSAQIQNSIAFVKANQNPDGGWSSAIGGPSDVDDSAAALMALMCAGEYDYSPVVLDGLQYLLDVQYSTGGFSCDEPQLVWVEGARTYNNFPNAVSGSLAMSAIVAVGRHPAQWPVAGPSVVDHLLSLQNDDGSFSYKSNEVGSDLALTTSLAVVALCYDSYPVIGASSGAVFQGDFNGDLSINFVDINSFVNGYIDFYVSDTLDPRFDFNRDGSMNFLDINSFVNYYIGYYTNPLSVSLCLSYGNGTAVWYNNTLLPAGSNFKELTEAVAYVNATWWSDYQAFFIDGINGVWSSSPTYWMWIYWDAGSQQWAFGPCGADRWLLSDGEILKWGYGVPDYP